MVLHPSPPPLHMGLPAISRLDALNDKVYFQKEPCVCGFLLQKSQTHMVSFRPSHLRSKHASHCHPIWGCQQSVGLMQYIWLSLILKYFKKIPVCLGLFAQETQPFKAPTYHCHPLWAYLQSVDSMRYLWLGLKKSPMFVCLFWKKRPCHLGSLLAVATPYAGGAACNYRM